MTYAKYTIEVFCELGDEDNPDKDRWNEHHGKGQTAAGKLVDHVNASGICANRVWATGRELVEEIPQWQPDMPQFADDPDPVDDMLASLLNSRKRLRGELEEDDDDQADEVPA